MTKFRDPHSRATFEEHTYWRSVSFIDGVAEVDDDAPNAGATIEYLANMGYARVDESPSVPEDVAPAAPVEDAPQADEPAPADDAPQADKPASAPDASDPHDAAPAADASHAAESAPAMSDADDAAPATDAANDGESVTLAAPDAIATVDDVQVDAADAGPAPAPKPSRGRRGSHRKEAGNA